MNNQTDTMWRTGCRSEKTHKKGQKLREIRKGEETDRRIVTVLKGHLIPWTRFRDKATAG